MFFFFQCVWDYSILTLKETISPTRYRSNSLSICTYRSTTNMLMHINNMRSREKFSLYSNWFQTPSSSSSISFSWLQLLPIDFSRPLLQQCHAAVLCLKVAVPRHPSHQQLIQLKFVTHCCYLYCWSQLVSIYLSCCFWKAALIYSSSN
jgi:hypothetical protein